VENSVLISTRKVFGLAPDYTAFDTDLLTHINAALAILTQLGIGPPAGMMIEDDTTQWTDLGITPNALMNLCRTYVFLKLRIFFDPPPNKFHLQAVESTLTELEFRLHMFADSAEALPVVEPVRPVPPDTDLDDDEEEWWEALA